MDGMTFTDGQYQGRPARKGRSAPGGEELSIFRAPADALGVSVAFDSFDVVVAGR